ncbi:MarR family winged helix-turn-helix transcriptional regulator [Ottowia thiooxydans]
MNSALKPQGCTNLKLRQLTRLATRHYDQYVASAGLKNTQYALLSHVVGLGPIEPGELARRMQMDASTLTRNLQPLSALGLIEVRAGKDARSRLVEATSAGRAKRSETQLAWKAAQVALNERLGEDRVAALHELLDACIGCFDESVETGAASSG